MKTFSCNALSIALGLFLQILAFEQITFADNIYNQLNDQLKAGPDAAANYGRNIGIQNNPGGLRIPNLNSCVKLSNGTESCPSGNDKLIAHERSIPLAALMPGVLSTNADLHNSLNRRALENSSLLSEKTMRAVTSLLTESGIGQGIHHADVETMLLQLNMALHEIKVATVAKNILPETLPLTREVYNCIEERMQEEGWNYVDAFAQCQFDQPGVTVPSKPIQPGAMADGFFKYNPAYSNGPLNDGKEARLLDWIFNGAGGDQSGTRAAFFKEHWRYGDVVYKVERVTTPFPGATPLPGATPIPGTSGLPRARYQLLEEPDRAWIEYQKRIQEVFSAELTLAHDLCTKVKNAPTRPVGGLTTTPSSGKLLPRASLVGWDWDGDTTNRLSYLMNKIKEVKHNCYQFDPDLITGTIDPGQPLPLENYFKNTVVPANESIPDLYEFMHAMARQIAYGQILAEGMLAESVLETLNENAGDVERELIVRGKELIYRALGTRQIEGLYTTNIDAIRAIVEKAGQEEEDSGPSGREIN